MNDNIFLLLFAIALSLIGIFGFFLGVIIVVTNRKRRQQQLQEQMGQAAHERALTKARVQETELTLTRISHELHEVVCQELFGLQMHLQQLAKSIPTAAAGLLYPTSTAAAILEKLRDLSHGKNSDYLKQKGLLKFLEERVLKINLSTHMNAGLRIVGSIPQDIEDAELYLIRIAGELIQNAIKHSEAAQLNIDVQCSAENIQLTISDNGLGFTYQGAAYPNGMGLTQMHTYAAEIKAELCIESAPGNGTRAHLYYKLE